MEGKGWTNRGRWRQVNIYEEFRGKVKYFSCKLCLSYSFFSLPFVAAFLLLLYTHTLTHEYAECLKDISCVPYCILPLGRFNAADFVPCTHLVMGGVVPNCTLPFCTYFFCLFVFLLLLLSLLTDGEDGQTPLRNFSFVLSRTTLSFLDSFKGTNTILYFYIPNILL